MDKAQVLEQHAFLLEKAGQMQANIDRRIQEGTTADPPLDDKSPANAGKTQQQIDISIRDSYQAQADALKEQYPEYFQAEVVP